MLLLMISISCSEKSELEKAWYMVNEYIEKNYDNYGHITFPDYNIDSIYKINKQDIKIQSHFIALNQDDGCGCTNITKFQFKCILTPMNGIYKIKSFKLN